MKQLTDNHSSETTFKAILYLRVQLVRKPVTANPDSPDSPKQLILECDEQLEKLHSSQMQELKAMASRMGINAELQQAASESYHLILQIAREVRALVQGDVSDPVYLKLFPKSPSSLISPNSEYMHHIDYAIRIRETLTNDPDYASLAHYAPKLEETTRQIQDLLGRRSICAKEENDASIAVKKITESAQAFYNHAYTRLLMYYRSNKKIVEPCFFKLSTKKKKKAGEGEDAEGNEEP